MIIKKRVLIFAPFTLFILLLILLISAQSDPSEKITSSLGEIDEEKGMPKKWVEWSEKAEQLKKEEERKEYLKKEWTKLLANNEFFGPILFYTDKFFSFFNFIWRYSFGMEFEWSGVFFLHLFVWGLLVFFIFFPAKEIFKSRLFGLITSIVVASISGAFRIITIAVSFLETIFGRLLYITLFFAVLIIIIILYERFFIKSKKESREEMLKRTDDAREAAGEAAERFLDS